jgi:hypothetical protein
VHLVHGPAQYHVRWDGRGRVTLGPDTLVVEKGPERFPGFERGEDYVVGVGADEADGSANFNVAWATLVHVRE